MQLAPRSAQSWLTDNSVSWKEGAHRTPRSRIGRDTPEVSTARRRRSPIEVHCLGNLSTPMTYSCDGRTLMRSDCVG
eukprot:6201981-Pleurochrysis_carterae.AAC.1